MIGHFEIPKHFSLWMFAQNEQQRVQVVATDSRIQDGYSGVSLLLNFRDQRYHAFTQ